MEKSIILCVYILINLINIVGIFLSIYKNHYTYLKYPIVGVVLTSILYATTIL